MTRDLDRIRLLFVLAACLVAIGVVVGVIAATNNGDRDLASTDTSDQSLTDFIAQAKVGDVVTVRVDGDKLEYELVDSGDTIYKTKMESGDTIRQILQDAGIAPEDFPIIEIGE